MSIDASWDLRSSSTAPKSLCVYNAVAGSQDTNPFEVAAGAADTLTAQAVVFGTEKGSLHYRTYPTPLAKGESSTNTNTNSQANQNAIRPPLGAERRPPTNLPRAYLPVDLAGSSLPGAVVGVILAKGSPPHRPVFLVLVDDNRGAGSQGGQYASLLVTLTQGSFSKLPMPSINGVSGVPRVSCATFHSRCGFVMAGGKKIFSIPPEALLETSKRRPNRRSHIDFSNVTLPSPGARGGQDAIQLIFGGRVAILAVGNSVIAVAGQEREDSQTGTTPKCVKVISFAQSSQVHPVIILDIEDPSMDSEWSSLLLANGRECAVIDLQYAQQQISCAPPRNGTVKISSPILAAAASWPWLALLTSDGLVSIRSPSCLAIPLKTLEVGTRPNDFFVLRTFPDDSMTNSVPYIVSGSYSGQAKVLHCKPDNNQDLADRLMRHAIDAFGANGFPRSELAEATSASFTATSYVGPEAGEHSRDLLRQYLEAILGLAEFEGGASTGWPTEQTSSGDRKVYSPKTASFRMDASSSSAFMNTSRQASTAKTGRTKAESLPVVTEETPDSLVTATALLCLVCWQLRPAPKPMLANRAAKACATKLGIVVEGSSHGLSSAATAVCEAIADKLLLEANQGVSGTVRVGNVTASTAPRKSTFAMEFVEAATWLLRACGRHERAIDILFSRMKKGPEVFWSAIKYDSYTATHLSDLWATGQESACNLVLRSPATRRLLENNPAMGLGIFTVNHPRNQSQWEHLIATDDPLSRTSFSSEVVALLKGVVPRVVESPSENDTKLPLDTGRALAIAFLESALGINTSRPTEANAFDLVAQDEKEEERITDFHDELCYLLLEGVIAQRGDKLPQDTDNNDDSGTTNLEKMYRQNLRRFLQWPLAKVRSERLLNSLPSSFLQEKALCMGRLGKHEDALRILYNDCKSMDLALKYCDLRHERQQAQIQAERTRLSVKSVAGELENMNPFVETENRPSNQVCAFLPLVKVALESDSDKNRGTAAAIQVLALRRNVIDRAAALRLLPKNVPLAAVARPFLIPALVESESHTRRLKLVSSLLRARHNTLKHRLTDAQLKAQANIHVVPYLKTMNLGEPIHTTKAFKARSSPSVSSTFPNVIITKYTFPRHVIIQAKVTNNSKTVDGRSLGNVALVVAESSEEAIQPTKVIPIKVLPYDATGSSWCILSAAPNRMEGSAILTCELRYTVMTADAKFRAGVSGRNFVEELQDLEVSSSAFSP